MVAATAGAQDAAVQLRTGVAAVLAQLLAERRELRHDRVEGAVPARLPGQDRGTQRFGIAARECRVALADRTQRMGVTVADGGKAELVRECDDAPVRPPNVVGLNASSASGR